MKILSLGRARVALKPYCFTKYALAVYHFGMELLSINVGPVRSVDLGERTVRSAIVKEPVDGPVMITAAGVDGNEIGYEHHGGPDQAVYAYAAEHYDHWARELNRDDLTYGMMGENLTVRGWLDEEVSIGDEFRVGGIVVRVTGPRIPCDKLDWRLGVRGFSKRFAQSRRFGLYLHVVEPGEVCAGDKVEIVRRDPAKLGLIELAELFLYRPKDVDGMRRALEVEGLGERCRAAFTKRIAKADRA
jgi:MOSC domain-containing protein YiiM